MGSARDNLREFPLEVRREIGFALYEAQRGAKHAAAKPLKGFGGAGVLEFVEDYDGSTYRASTRSVSPARCTCCTPSRRSPGGNLDAETRHGADPRAPEGGRAGSSQETAEMNQRTKITRGSGNVFADLGIPNPEEALAKAELAHEIARIIREKRLSQAAAADLLGIDQPKVSALVRGRLSGFSMDRLLRFLTRLDYDVRIAIRPRRGSGAARVRVLAA